MIRISSWPVACSCIALLLSISFSACDSVTDPDNGENGGEPVFSLADIDGAWQQEDESRRYLDIISDAGDEGEFYEAFFQDDEGQFEQTDCYTVVRNEVINEDEGQFSIRVFEEDEEPQDILIRFEVDTNENDTPQRVRLIKEDDTFDAWFEPSGISADDFEPQCSDVDENGEDNGNGDA